MQLTNTNILAILLTLSVTSSAWCQDASAEPKVPANYQENDAKNRAKTTPHEELAARAGNWKVTTTMSKMFGGATEVGEATMESVLDGKFVLLRGKGSMMGQSMETLSLYGYDTLQEEYTIVNMNSLYTTMYDMRGKMRDDGVVEFKGIMKDAMSPDGRPYRAERKTESSDKFVVTVYDGHGDQEFEVFTMTYERVK